MSIQRIEKVVERKIESTKLDATETRRLELHQAITFERVRSIGFSDGSRIDIPQLRETELKALSKLYEPLSPEQRTTLSESAENLATAIYSEPAGLGSVSGGLRQTFDSSFETHLLTTGVKEQNDATQGFLLNATAGIENQLRDFAYKVKGRQQLSADLRTDVTELRDALSQWPEGQDKQTFSWREVTIEKDGSVKIVEHTDEPLTKTEAQALMEKLEGQLGSVRDMTEMDKYDLQDLTQKYQQALSTLSAIIKMQHDSLKSIIQNVKS